MQSRYDNPTDTAAVFILITKSLTTRPHRWLTMTILYARIVKKNLRSARVEYLTHNVSLQNS